VAKNKSTNFISTESLNESDLKSILESANEIFESKNCLNSHIRNCKNKLIFNLFFEPSTRTRTTFEIASSNLQAKVVNFNIENSSQTKGESLIDTISNLSAMRADCFIIRHKMSGAANLIAKHTPNNIGIINAGDGSHAHPTQALVDAFTVSKKFNNLRKLKLAIVGDILHSRVARSQIDVFKKLGISDIRLIGPETILPKEFENFGVSIHRNIENGIKDVNVIICLRIQNERMSSMLLPSKKEYFALYGLTQKRIKSSSNDLIVMHPGPINRGVEIDSAVADSTYSMILDQVSYGVAVRMAIINKVLNG
jgi:aspartate carbamoyltransferase catalytic subunit